MEIYCLPLIGDAWAIQLTFQMKIKDQKLKIENQRFTRCYYPIITTSLSFLNWTCR